MTRPFSSNREGQITPFFANREIAEHAEGSVPQAWCEQKIVELERSAMIRRNWRSSASRNPQIAVLIGVVVGISLQEQFKRK